MQHLDRDDGVFAVGGFPRHDGGERGLVAPYTPHHQPLQHLAERPLPKHVPHLDAGGADLPTVITSGFTCDLCRQGGCMNIIPLLQIQQCGYYPHYLVIKYQKIGTGAEYRIIHTFSMLQLSALGADF